MSDSDIDKTTNEPNATPEAKPSGVSSYWAENNQPKEKGDEPAIGGGINKEATNKEGEPQKEGGDEEGKKEPKETGEVDYAKIEMPEGFEVNGEVLAEVSPILKELNCSAEQATKLFAIASKMVEEANDKQNKSALKYFDEQKSITEKDPVLSKPENLAIAARAFEQFAKPELKEFMKQGWGDHPLFVDLFYQIGVRMSEDNAVLGTASNQEGAEFYDLLYRK